MRAAMRPDLAGPAAFARRFAEVAARLSRPASIPAALLRNATSDPLPVVRAINAGCLFASFPDSPEAATARIELAKDPDGRVRAVLDPAGASGALALSEASAEGALSTPATPGAVSLKQKS